jgi:hypothetical protein
MCNLYSQTKGQAAIVALTRALRDSTGNLPPLPGIFPDHQAPVVANRGGIRELCMMRWGMPSSQKAQLDAAGRRADKLRAKRKPVDFSALLRMEPDGGITNIRNTSSPHWTRWLGIDNRCVVPFRRLTNHFLGLRSNLRGDCLEANEAHQLPHLTLLIFAELQDQRCGRFNKSLHFRAIHIDFQCRILMLLAPLKISTTDVT